MSQTQKKKANQILILCFFMAIIFGCSKKASDSVTPSAIVGKWKDAGTKGSFTINFMGQMATESLDEVATGSIAEFKSDGSIIDLSALTDETKFTKYKTSGNLLTLIGTDNGKAVEFVFNFTVNGSTLLLTMDKTLFAKNVEAIAAADPTSDLADAKEFIPYITAFKYENTLLKQ